MALLFYWSVPLLLIHRGSLHLKDITSSTLKYVVNFFLLVT